NILREEVVDSGLLEDLTGWLPWSENVKNLIRQSGRNWSFGVVTVVSLGAIAAIFLIVSLLDLPLPIAAAIAVAAGVSPYVYLHLVREVRFRHFAALLPEAVDLMARGLRAGHSIAAVLEMVGTEIGDPIGSEFRAMHKEQSLGLPMREAVMNLLQRMPRDDMRFLATAILLQKESGGNL